MLFGGCWGLGIDDSLSHFLNWSKSFNCFEYIYDRVLSAFIEFK